MTGADPVQCAVCGWTGHAGELETRSAAPACPVCGEDLGPRA